MILDAQDLFSDAQAVTATAISTNVRDNGSRNTTRDLGNGQDMWLVILVGTAATAAGAATVTFSLESATDAGLTTGLVVHWTSAVIGKASLIANFVVAKIRLPSDLYGRFLGLRYTVATGPLTAGTFKGFLVSDEQSERYPASGISIQ